MRKVYNKQLENHWAFSPRGTVRDSSGPSIPSYMEAQKGTKPHPQQAKGSV